MPDRSPSRSPSARKPSLQPTQLSKAFEPGQIEPRWYEHWLELKLFQARPRSRSKPYTIAIPPPNVTGSLHMGHALIYTLQDIVIRRRRMQGYDVLWIPGTDHAGIATQLMVERALEAEGTSREQLGREGFLKRAWAWKEEYGGRVLSQLRALGCSCDWSRLRFTLDDGLSHAVREAFVRLHQEGLIYRGQYIVNWCPRCQTALSDLEVTHEETAAKLYRIRYPLVQGGGEIVVATTRPETMLGDTAVAVHPDDERYASLIGKRVRLPVLGREIPVIADSWVQRQFGTGAVKVTPAHDPNDFKLGQRHALESVQVMDEEGRMTAEAGPFAGLDRFECRARLIDRLRQDGLLISTEDHSHALGHCQRCRTIVEPFLSQQWFVRVAPLAQPAIEAVRRGRIRFIPEMWSKTYFEWMNNLHDWCISRQLWWGHRIPAWHCRSCAHIEVACQAPARCPRCGGGLEQDPDVLDTWFSSALWPFSTLGWPERTADLKRYYPTTAMITGFDIIFFWVARMIMMGLKFTGEVPFREVYFSGLVRDAQGQKMSKTRGNVIDPLDVLKRYGTDAVRFTLASQASPGSDIPLAEERMEGYRAFANKLWNAARFVLLNLQGDEHRIRFRRADLILADRWILDGLARTTREVNEALDSYRYDQAANAIYHFVWHQFCDWYIELVKPSLTGSESRTRAAARSRAVLLRVLDDILRLLHPFMPYITEDLWQRLPGSRGALAGARFPRTPPSGKQDRTAHQFEKVIELITRVRHVRAENNIDPGRRIQLLVKVARHRQRTLFVANQDHVLHLARCEQVRFVDSLESVGAAARGVAGEAEFAIPLEGVLDLAAEQRRLSREIDRLVRDMEAQSRKLSSQDFLSKAPAAVIARTRNTFNQMTEKKARLEATLRHLSPGEPPS
ncbi:MAG: valine--tRNA ligase [Acidobacteriota bacterium]